MRINNNVFAQNTHRQLFQTSQRLGKSLERLSSGMRINRAADDAAGLGVSEKLRFQVSGLDVAISNCQDGIAIIQTAEGALDRTHVILRRIRDLTEASANGDKTNDDRDKYQSEIDQLVKEVDRIALTTEYNTKKLLNGALGVSVTDDPSKLSPLSNPAAVRLKSFVKSVTVVGDLGEKGVYTVQLATALDTDSDKVANTQYAAGRSIATAAPVTGTDTLQAAFGMVTAGESETLTFEQPCKDKLTRVTLGQADTINEAVGKLQSALDQAGFGVDVSWDYTNSSFLFESQKRGSDCNFFVSGLNSTGVGNESIVSNDAANAVDIDGNGYYDDVNGAGIDAIVFAAADISVEIFDPRGSVTTVTSRSSTFKADMETYDKDRLIDDTGYNQGIIGLEFTLDIDGVAMSYLANSIKAGIDVSGVLTIQAGPNKGDDHRISMAIADMGAGALGIEKLDVTTQEAAQNLIDSEDLDYAIAKVSEVRGNLGAFQNRLEHTVMNLQVTRENLASSESRIRDTDMAAEMMEFTRNQIMQQAGTAMMAQANAVTQSVLQLLG